jgi:opacity protein-like surface antigen
MKKIVLATLVTLAAMATSAQAVEVGVVGGTDFLNHGGNRGTGGLTVGEHFGPWSLTLEADREVKKDTNKFGAVVGYDLFKVGAATVAAKGGVEYVQNSAVKSEDRYVPVVGAGVAIPVTGKVAATVDYRWQGGDGTASAFRGNTLLVGAKYAF